jgi:hypothetical protein
MKQRDVAVRAQAHATAVMAAANMRKAHILHDQATLSLFTMPNEESWSDLAREYVNLRREEEMEKLRCHIAEEKVAKARAAIEAKTLADIQAVEVALATRNRIPPASQHDLPTPALCSPSPLSTSPPLSLEGLTPGK